MDHKPQLLLASDILIALFLTAGVENFSGLPRGGFLIQTGTLWPTTLLLIFCDATLVVVFSLHLLNVEAKLWTVLFFKATAILCPQNPSELFLGQLESQDMVIHLVKNMILLYIAKLRMLASNHYFKSLVQHFLK